MKIKLKSGYTKINISKSPPTKKSDQKDTNKVYAKSISMEKPSCKNTDDSSVIIPVNGYDIGNYIAKYNMANFQIQAVMRLDGKLDYDKLVRSVRLLVDVEPILGCQFIKSHRAYWKRFDDIDEVRFCSMEETKDPGAAVQRFLQGPLHMDKGPMFLVKLIRSGGYDTLCVKINHACSDAAGAREFIMLLSDIYSRIDDSKNLFVPHPSIRSMKDHEKLVYALGKDNPETTWGPQQQFASATWKFPWRNARVGTTEFAISRLSSESFEVIKKYAKARGATVNDMILTAIFRAMFDISKPSYGVPMDIPITIDLRKYLPDQKADAIRNLSGGIVIRITRKSNESFEGTLSRIMSCTKEIKNKHPSAQNAKMADYIQKMNFHQVCGYFKAVSQLIDFASLSPFYVVDKCSPVLSNFGFISKTLIKFGDNVVTDAYIIPPVVRAPGILLVTSTYNDIMTFGVGYYKPSIKKAYMEGLLNKIKDELLEGCRE